MFLVALLLGARLMPKPVGPALWPIDSEDGYADINDYACRLTSSGGSPAAGGVGLASLGPSEVGTFVIGV